MHTLARTAAASAASAVVGGLASRDASSGWYARLSKPSFQPPAAAFPIVWTALYTDIAVSSATVIDALKADGRTAEATAYERALALNLALNTSWTWVFFRAHRLGPAVLTAGALAASCADLVRRAAPVSRPAAVALAPYAAWCGFATVLSGAIWRRNR
ncbi:MAG TPA: TspO/MBR family protein [Mycobacteriales bacterium]|nr:TspO/MBR family protein [Mycobacteriales bacterium]